MITKGGKSSAVDNIKASKVNTITSSASPLSPETPAKKRKIDKKHGKH